MFYEKDQSGKCYKSFAKWDMPFDRDQVIHELIIKRQIEANHIESEQVKASREYLWTRMTEAIFNEEPIQFYSSQMKKFYLPPEIKMGLQKRPPELAKGIDQRRYVKVSDEVEMVIPDTYEKEKWETSKPKDKKEQRVQIEIKVDDQDKVVQQELTPSEKLDIKYGNMYETLDCMKDQQKIFDKYVRMVTRKNNTLREGTLSPDIIGRLSPNPHQSSAVSILKSQTAASRASPQMVRRNSIKKTDLVSMS